MIKALVSIDADLPSSIALRYTCLLAKMMEVEIQTIHVQEPQTAGRGIGTGWARRTYEKELIQECEKEISQLLIAESGFCPVLNKPLIVPGDREKEILNELSHGAYQLFVEGLGVQSAQRMLSKHVKSRLYQHIQVPVLVVQNLLPIKRVLCMVEDERDGASLFGKLATLLNGLKLEMDIACSAASRLQNCAALEAALSQMVQNHGWTPGKFFEWTEHHEAAFSSWEDYSLVALQVDREGRGRGLSNSRVGVLGHFPCPILLCWK